MTLTIRQLWERVRDRHADHMTVNEARDPYELCEACDAEWPCADHKDAVAALKAIDEADHACGFTVVPDDHPGPDPAPPTENT